MPALSDVYCVACGAPEGMEHARSCIVLAARRPETVLRATLDNGQPIEVTLPDFTWQEPTNGSTVETGPVNPQSGEWIGIINSWADIAHSAPNTVPRMPPRRIRNRPREQTRPVAKRPKVLTLKRARQILLDALEELSVERVCQDFVFILGDQYPRTPRDKLQKTAKRILQEAGLKEV